MVTAVAWLVDAAIRTSVFGRLLVVAADYAAECILGRKRLGSKVTMEVISLRINLMQGCVKWPGIRYSPFSMVDLSCGTVGAVNGMFPISTKYKRMPRAQMSTGLP